MLSSHDRTRNWKTIISDWMAWYATFVLSVYIWVMAVVYPLYLTKDGYVALGRHKYEFFRWATIILLMAVAVPLAMKGARAIARLWRDRAKISIRLSGTQWAVVAFLLAASLSTILSPYRATAWSGHDGWYIGLETLWLLMLVYVLIGCCWTYRDNIWLGFMASAGIAFFLGLCNRFWYYPIHFEVTNPAFISTLGNSNWVAGYFSVLWPIGAGLYVFAARKVCRYIAGAYTFLAMCLGIVQGADSAFLSFAAVFYLLVILGMGRWQRYGGACLELMLGWCMAAQLMRVLRAHMLSYRQLGATWGGIGDVLTTTSLTLYLLVPLAALYVLTKRGNARFLRLMDARWAKRSVLILPLLVVLALTALARAGLLVFDNDFGNGRGLTWQVGVQLLDRMDSLQRLIGIGPDCFAEYLYGFPDLAAVCNEYFDGQVLKNAHNEILTMTVNVGLLGTVAYIGIFATAFVRLMKSGADEPQQYIPALCMFSYLLHNMVSFTQILNLPFVLLVMAIGEAEMRKKI